MKDIDYLKEYTQNEFLKLLETGIPRLEKYSSLAYNYEGALEDRIEKGLSFSLDPRSPKYEIFKFMNNIYIKNDFGFFLYSGTSKIINDWIFHQELNLKNETKTATRLNN